MNSKFIFLFSIIFNFYKISSIRFYIDGSVRKEFCITKKFNLPEEISLSYVLSSGHYTDKCNVFLLDPDNKIVYKNYNSVQGEMPTYKSQKEGEYKLCITPLSKSKFYVSLQFYKLNEMEFSRSLAKDGIN